MMYERKGGENNGFFSSPKEMFKYREEQCKKNGDRLYAKAKNGEGDHYYGGAKKQYKMAKENGEKAKKAKNSW